MYVLVGARGLYRIRIFIVRDANWKYASSDYFLITFIIRNAYEPSSEEIIITIMCLLRVCRVLRLHDNVNFDSILDFVLVHSWLQMYPRKV